MCIRDRFEAALGVFRFYAQKQSDDCFENKGDEFPVPFSLHFFITIGDSSGPNNHNKFTVVLLFQLIKTFPDMFEFRKSGGSIGIDHQDILSSGDWHACSDCSSFSSIMGVLDYDKRKTEFIGFFEGNAGGLVLAAIITNDDFVGDLSWF